MSLGNPLVCDCELRWYRQWIEEEWNPVEESWLKDTFCLDRADNESHNIAEVPLKDMFCLGDVRDKPSTRVKFRLFAFFQNRRSCIATLEKKFCLLIRVLKLW